MIRSVLARPRRSARILVASLLAVVVGVGTGACDRVSLETRDAAQSLVCDQIDFGSSEIESDPRAARLVALVVRDLAPDGEIKDVAAAVAEDPSRLDLRQRLADYVRDTCGR